MQDPYGNFLARVSVPDKTDHFVVDVELVAEMSAFNPFDFFLDPDARKAPFAYPRKTSGNSPHFSRQPRPAPPSKSSSTVLTRARGHR